MIVQALYIDSNGPYPILLGPENCWDATRDARKFAGKDLVVAHPPCQLWVNLTFVNYKRYGGDHNKPGNDGGCFAHALDTVRRNGGVLEHPGSSHAWKHFSLNRPPTTSGWGMGQKSLFSTMYEYTCEVYQSSYGHKAQKRTWLLYCGKQPPFELRWGKEPGTHQIGWFDRNKPTLGKKEASRTPVEFAEDLIKLAKWSQDI